MRDSGRKPKVNIRGGRHTIDIGSTYYRHTVNIGIVDFAIFMAERFLMKLC